MKTFLSFFLRRYPRNYLLENQVTGAVILSLFTFVFIILYKPLDVKASAYMGFVTTMGVYSIGMGFSFVFFLWILNRFRWFSDIKEWTLVRELVSVIIILLGVGTVVYLMGFIVESDSDRLNAVTFLDSVSRSFLLGLIPFIFFSATNFRYLLNEADDTQKNRDNRTINISKIPEKHVVITSKLKKEELRFYPAQFIYAEADGNYVVFYLLKNDLIRKETIRNSISNVEEQLKELPGILRTHRAFIVNLKKVLNRKGNILGYQLKLEGVDSLIPVSRNNISRFDKVFDRYS